MKLEDYDKYYINGSDHYLIPKDEFVELFDEMVNWREESKQLKKVIDKVKKFIHAMPCCDDYLDTILEILKEK